MARYRPVSTHIWKDPAFQRYTSKQKLIFLYLISNESTTESGIYPVTTTTIAQGTDISEKEVTKIMQNGFKNVTYDLDDEMIFVHYFLRYNRRGRPENIRKSIENDFNRMPHPLWHIFKKLYPAFCNDLSFNSIKDKNYSISIEKCSEHFPMSSEHLTKLIKNKYLDYVLLTDKEKKNLDAKYGSAKVEVMIERLNNYIGSSGKKYKSHYFAILNWVVKDVMGDISLKSQQSTNWTCKICHKEKDSIRSDGICDDCIKKG